jgi:hypothetical protein
VSPESLECDLDAMKQVHADDSNSQQIRMKELKSSRSELLRQM